MANKSVFVCGPAGCGKTKNRESFLEKFGLKSLSDGWVMGDDYLESGVLYLTNESVEEVKDIVGDDCRVLSFDDAMKCP